MSRHLPASKNQNSLPATTLQQVASTVKTETQWSETTSAHSFKRWTDKPRHPKPLFGFIALCSLIALGFGLGHTSIASAADMPNTCPVDGCDVSIATIEKEGPELKVTLNSNFTPDNSKNHFHMWWGEQYKPEQVGRNAKSEYNVEQGKWHRHDDYPVYITTGSASVEVREGAVTLCVTAADGDHNVLDAENFHCMNVSDHL